jgi:hypothetical protein
MIVVGIVELAAIILAPNRVTVDGMKMGKEYVP